jgi:hypothetical protein
MSDQLPSLLNRFGQAFAENYRLESALKYVLYGQVQHVIQDSRFRENAKLLQAKQKFVFHFLALFGRFAYQCPCYASEL